MQRKEINKLTSILVQLTIVTLISLSLFIVYKSSAEDLTTTQESTFKIDGMVCSMCSITIKTALKKLDGVIDTDISYKNKEAKVVYVAGKVTEDEMLRAIENAGFGAVVINDKEEN
jgi:copper chaperone CopZ